MYKGYGTVLITGGIASGKTSFLKKYINEVINDKNNIIYIFDSKTVEFVEYKNFDNVIYVDIANEFADKVYNTIINDKDNSRKYLFIDEYSDVRLFEDLHKKVKYLMYNRDILNLDVAIASQDKTSFCNGMKANADMIVNIKRWRSNDKTTYKSFDSFFK